MAHIEVKNLFKIFGPKKECQTAVDLGKEGASADEIFNRTQCTIAVNDASFTVEGAEIFVIMGLSGSGKSTLLRCVNRLIEPTFGHIAIDGEDVMKMSPKELLELRKQKTAMVFQHFGLMEHRNVLGNTAFGLELRGVPEEERRQKALDALKLVQLEDYAENLITELSGGMQQRVGLARALATDAEILLMDEAFSALDPLTRTQMQVEFLGIQDQMPKTILFITHDLGEALTMGDRIAILNQGAIVQIGGPEEIVTNPKSDYVESFVENVDRSRVLTAGKTAKLDQPLVSAGDDVHQVIELMENSGMPFLFVTDHDRLEGVVRLLDAEREARKENPDLKNIIQPPPKAVKPGDRLITILAKASSISLPLPVVDEGGRLEGVVTKDMILRAIGGVEE